MQITSVIHYDLSVSACITQEYNFSIHIYLNKFMINCPATKTEKMSHMQLHVYLHAYLNIFHVFSIQAVFRKKKFQSPLKPFTSGYKLEDYVIGKQIGKGCNAAVYEAAAPFAFPAESDKCSLVELNQKETDDDNKKAGPLRFPTTPSFPLAMKMMWNIGVRSYSILALLTLIFSCIVCRMHLHTVFQNTSTAFSNDILNI